jgi:hypothetical protein
MPVPIHFPPPGFDDLSIDEKIDYLELLWSESRPVLSWSSSQSGTTK